jgi:amidase
MAFKEYGSYDGSASPNSSARNRSAPANCWTRRSPAPPRSIRRSMPSSSSTTTTPNADRQGLPDGPFTGVPFLLKDLDLLEGTRTTSGASVYKDNVADHTGTLAQRFLDAGVTIFGKSSSPEFGLMPTTESRLFGPTRNPWNLAHSSGGSSGGAARRLPRAFFPSRMPATAAARSAFRPPPPACSD